MRRSWVTMVALIAVAAPVRVGSSAAGTIDAEIRATDAQNRQLDAAMTGLRPVRPLRPKRGAGASGNRAGAAHVATPVISTPSSGAAHDTPGTAGRHYEVGPVTITPGGFLSVDGFTR